MAEPPGETFSYHRAIAPMLWVFVALASIELIVDQLLIAHWSRPVALALSVLTFGSVAWLIGVIRSFRRLPVIVTPDTLVMRAGSFVGATVPLASVAGLREHWDAAALKRRGVLKLSLIAYPNVIVDLRRPVRAGRREITAFAHRLDDPAGFARALDGAQALHG